MEEGYLVSKGLIEAMHDVYHSFSLIELTYGIDLKTEREWCKDVIAWATEEDV